MTPATLGQTVRALMVAIYLAVVAGAIIAGGLSGCIEFPVQYLLPVFLITVTAAVRIGASTTLLPVNGDITINGAIVLSDGGQSAKACRPRSTRASPFCAASVSPMQSVQPARLP